MRTLELCVGLGLLLGPLAYALTLQPEVVEVVEVVEALPPSAEPMTATCSEPAEAVTEPAQPEPAQSAPEPEPEPEPEPAPSVESRIPLAFANTAGLVLSLEADPDWGKGRLREHPGPGQFRAAKRADPALVPAALWAQRGRTFDVYGASGKLCTARLGELSVLVQHDGPSLYDVFIGNADDEGYEGYEEFEQREHTAKEIRAKVWSHASPDTAWLVAELVSDSPCEGALWARDAELPPPVVLHRSDEPSPVTERRLAEHEASSTLAAMKAAHEEWVAELPAEDRQYHQDWDAIAREYPATARAWLDEAGAAQLVELEFGYTAEGCGDFPETSISSLDLVVGSGFAPTDHAIGPVAVFDVDGDGHYELHYGDTIVSETPELTQSAFIYEQFYCPC